MMESSAVPDDLNLTDALSMDLQISQSHRIQEPQTTATSSSISPSSGSAVLMPPSALPPFTLSGSPLSVPVPSNTTGSTAIPIGLIPTSNQPTQAGVGPPPKSGFQPLPHPSPAASHSVPASHDPAPTPPAGSVGVNLFTPQYDPNSISSYSQSQSSTYQSAPYPNSPPGVMASPYEASSSINIPYDELAEQGYHRNTHLQDPNSFIDWLKHNETVKHVVEKAKVGVQAMITTMDPQMRDVLYSGGDINVVVASGKAVKVEPVKEAFQSVFGRATVSGQDSQPGIAPQPVGFPSGVKGAEERIESLRRSAKVSDKQVCMAVENFIVDLAHDMWYDIAALVLNDPVNNITLHAYSQPTPVTLEYVNQAQFETPKDYILGWSGLSVTVGQVIQRQMGLESDSWHHHFGGFSRRELIFNAAKQLAFLYKQKLSNLN